MLVSHTIVKNFIKTGVLFVGRDRQTLGNWVIFKILSWVIFLSQEKICILYVCVCVWARARVFWC